MTQKYGQLNMCLGKKKRTFVKKAVPQGLKYANFLHKSHPEYYFARRSSTFPSLCDRLGECSPEYHFCRSGMTYTSSISREL